MLDLIGAARPSIADPFLPKKIEEGRIDDIRECIGCNICVAGDFTMTPMPLHAEPDHGRGMAARLAPGARSAREGSDAKVLVVGAGPAGLEAAMMLGRRGYEVALAETGELGGRVLREAKLPGPLRLEARGGLSPGPDPATLTNVDALPRQRADGGRHAGLRLRARGDRHRLRLARATAWGAACCSPRRSPAPMCCRPTT